MTRVGGLPDIINDGENGLISEPGDPADLAMKITQVLADTALSRRLGSRAREMAETRYSWEATARTIKAVCERL